MGPFHAAIPGRHRTPARRPDLPRQTPRAACRPLRYRGLTAVSHRPAGPLSVPVHDAVSAPRIGGLDFLRAVSILLVMLEHAAEGGEGGLRHVVGGLASLGVEIFFVISGFLITSLLLAECERRGRIAYVEFYRRRVARLMPVFFLYLGLATAILLVRGKPVPWAAAGSAVFYVINYYQAFTGAQTNIVAHCWSLAVEEQFYVIWPLALGALAARGIGLARALVFVVLLVWCWRWGLTAAGVSEDYLYRALDTRMDHLAVGCLVAVLLRMPDWRARIDALCRHRVAPWIGLLLVAGLYASAKADAASVAYKFGFGYMVEPLMVGLLIPLTVQAAQGGGALTRLLNHPLPVEIGKVSYGMYLFHGMIMYTVQRAVEARTGSEGLGVLLACVAVLVFASLSFRLFESPVRRWINSARLPA